MASRRVQCSTFRCDKELCQLHANLHIMGACIGPVYGTRINQWQVGAQHACEPALNSFLYRVPVHCVPSCLLPALQQQLERVFS